MENEIDLGLSLGITRDASAGANANQNLRIIDTPPTPTRTRRLSELVWSTQNGLTINECCIIKDETCHLTTITPPPFLASTLTHTDENHLTEMLNCNKGKEKECITSCASIPDANIVGTTQGPKTANLLPVLLGKEPENIADATDRFSLDFGLRLKVQKCPTKEEDCITAGCAPFLEKIEETAENDVILKNVDREDSHGESMNSGNNVISTGNKRWRFEEHLIIESKRIKKQSQECPPTVVKQQDSSFMNWISNMVKGVKPIGIDDHKTLNLVSKGLGFQTVFQSLYSQDGKRREETKTPIESSKSKEIILFNKTVSCHVSDDNDKDDSFDQKAFGNLWITRLSPKTPSNLLALNNKSADNVSASIGLNTPCKVDAFKDTIPTCLHIKENRNVLLKKKVSNLNEIPSTSEKDKLSNEDKILKIPNQIFDTIKRLRLSRTDILKWMNSVLPIKNLDGYFLRLRLAKWEEGVGGSGYYVACITDENLSKKRICVNIGGVECLVESRYISNCDFLEDEVVAWWRTSGGQALMEEKLTSKVEERNKLGF